MTIKDLEPRLVWQCFEEITQVPRPTHHLDKMREFLVGWAKRHGIPCRTDETGNVVMTKAATPGHEDAPTVILQGHQDMVAEKRADKVHDFLTDPITTIVEGDWLRADGTTLGADNGLGCAAAMAVLLDDSLVHGPIQALFTVDEEQGMTGAKAMSPDFVEGNIVLNLDSEEHGQLVVGCAGSKLVTATLRYPRVDAPADRVYFRAVIDKLKGGHSGLEIHLGRANANKQLARFLWELGCDVVIGDFDGGGLPNAIPMHAEAVFGVAADKAGEVMDKARAFDAMIHNEYALTENRDFTFTVVPADAPKDVLHPAYGNMLVAAIFAAPNAVQQMSAAAPGLVETSCNLASVRSDSDGAIVVKCHVRSFVDSCRDEIAERLEALFGMAGATVEFGEPSPGWAPNPDSKILHVASEAYEALFGTKPRIEAIHAGLECSLFLEKNPDLDIVSFGPTLKDIHSPAERANIPSVALFWTFLTDILRRLA